jgi:hypothetical protein
MPSTVQLFHSSTIHESGISDKFVTILTPFSKIVGLSVDVLETSAITGINAHTRHYLRIQTQRGIWLYNLKQIKNCPPSLKSSKGPEIRTADLIRSGIELTLTGKSSLDRGVLFCSFLVNSEVTSAWKSEISVTPFQAATSCVFKHLNYGLTNSIG